MLDFDCWACLADIMTGYLVASYSTAGSAAHSSAAQLTAFQPLLVVSLCF